MASAAAYIALAWTVAVEEEDRNRFVKRKMDGRIEDEKEVGATIVAVVMWGLGTDR